MAWNPGAYNKFKTERFAPFYDLLKLIHVKPNMNVIDLGCGTGELTRKLADALPGSTLLGIDSSLEMLEGTSNLENEQVHFTHRTIEEQLISGEKWDLIFSNAAIQWVNNHEVLIPQIISNLNKGGQLVVQIPAQHHNISNTILNELADEEPFKTALGKWHRNSPVLETETYAQLLFENGSNTMTVYEKIYPLVLPDANGLFDWVSGTALIPYTEKLETVMRERFILQYRKRLENHFKTSPVFYAFKRIIMEATF